MIRGDLKVLDLTNPKDCRWFCVNYEIPGKGKIEWVSLNSGRKVYFNSMSDEDAIAIANDLYRMHAEAERNRMIADGGLVQ